MRTTLNIIGVVLIVALIAITFFMPSSQWFYEKGKDISNLPHNWKPLNDYMAIYFFKMAIALDEKNIQPYYDISINYMNLAQTGLTKNGANVYDQIDLMKAFKYLQMAEILDPNAAELFRCKAVYYSCSGDNDKAIATIQKAVEIEPQNGKCHRSYGKILLELHLLTNETHYADQAIQEFKEAVKYLEEDRVKANCYYNIGFIYSECYGNYKESIPYYKEAVRISPYDGLFNSNYQRVLAKADETSAEVKAVGEAEKIKEEKIIAATDLKSLNDTINVYLSSGNYDKAVSLARKLIDSEPRNAGAVLILGKIYFDRREYDRAQAVFETVIKMDPKNSTAYGYLGHVCGFKKDYEGALRNYLKAESLGDKSAKVIYNISWAYFMLGNYEQYVVYLKKTLEINPKNGEAYLCLAQTYAGKNHDLFMQCLQTAVDHGVDNEYVYLTLSNIYMSKQDYYKAISILSKCISIKSNPIALNNLAWCYVCLKINQKEAVDLAAEADRLAPGRNYIIDTYYRAYLNLAEREIQEQRFLAAGRSYFMAYIISNHINLFWAIIVLVLSSIVLFIQFLLRYFLNYTLDEEGIKLVLMKNLLLGDINFKDIEEARELKGLAGFKYLIHVNWRNRISGRSVVIVRRNGPSVWLTPDDPGKFVEEVRLKLGKPEVSVFPEANIFS